MISSVFSRARRLVPALTALPLLALLLALLLAGCNRQPASAHGKSTAAAAEATALVGGAPERSSALSANSERGDGSAGTGASGCSAPAGGDQPGCQSPLETAVLAGGCFWGMEDILRKIPGVVQTEVGYTGGTTAAPRYEAVSTGATGHAEAVRVVFDPKVLSYADLLEHWFFRMHDPTTKDRQGNDRGTQYRSAIFFTSPEQEQVARDVIRRVGASEKWPAPIVTEVTPASTFTPAESYHQDYLQKNPGGYTCHYLRD